MWIGRNEEDAMKKGKKFEGTSMKRQTHLPWNEDGAWPSHNPASSSQNKMDTTTTCMDEEDLFVGSLRLPPPRRFGAPNVRSHQAAFPTGVSSPMLGNRQSNPNHEQRRRNILHPNDIDPLTMPTAPHLNNNHNIPRPAMNNMHRSEESSSAAAATSPVHAIFHSVFGFMSEQETTPSKQYTLNHAHGSPVEDSQPQFLPSEQEEEESHESERQRRLEEERQRIRRKSMGMSMNRLNVLLSCVSALSAAATSVPITLVPTIGDQLGETHFAARAAGHAVLGTALGKFLLGVTPDIFGARRISMLFAMFHATSLLLLSWSQTCSQALWACALVEFCQCVQWPCLAVILATHCEQTPAILHPNQPSQTNNKVTQDHHATSNSSHSNPRYEQGLYVTSLASRMGSLLAIPLSSLALRNTTWGWRAVARCGAWLSCSSALVMFLAVMDSPTRVHAPQNPIPSRHHHNSNHSNHDRRHHWTSWIHQVATQNVLPSMKAVLTSGTFWIVAMAHAGGAMVRSSERVLGTYYRDTSNGTISKNQAGGLSVVLSVGMLVGLAVCGKAFASYSDDARRRKRLVSHLYCITVGMCYMLALLAIPAVRHFLMSPSIVVMLQILATFVMGCGISTMYYYIPGIVGAAFGPHKGLYASYTDGVGCAISAIVWHIVDRAVGGRRNGGGWAYGWAAVALLVILSGVLMVEFFEHYFCRGGSKLHARHQHDVHTLSSDNHNHNNNQYPSSHTSPTPLVDEWSAREDHIAAEVGDSIRRRGKQILFAPASPLQLLKKKKHATRDNNINNNSNSHNDLEGAHFDHNKIDTVARPHASDWMNELRNDEQNNSNIEPSPQELKERVLKILDRKENRTCCDCSNIFPRWASIIVPTDDDDKERTGRGGLPYGCICCNACASFHRKLGTHLVFVRSVDHDTFTQQQVQALEMGGNRVVNSIFEATLPMKLGKHASASEREIFIVSKYQKREWKQSPQEDSLLLPMVSDSTFDDKEEISSNNISRSTAAASDSEEEDDEDNEHNQSLDGTKRKTIELVLSSPSSTIMNTSLLSIKASEEARSNLESFLSDQDNDDISGNDTSTQVPNSSSFDYSFAPVEHIPGDDYTTSTYSPNTSIVSDIQLPEIVAPNLIGRRSIAESHKWREIAEQSEHTSLLGRGNEKMRTSGGKQSTNSEILFL